ncbi:hypothetical protein EES47_24935 [Streptomyces sp. ADI98-12]|nr:hypothetical protein EES47_24935 [Streptomyces sp. ADI98-12]
MDSPCARLPHRRPDGLRRGPDRVAPARRRAGTGRARLRGVPRAWLRLRAGLPGPVRRLAARRRDVRGGGAPRGRGRRGEPVRPAPGRTRCRHARRHPERGGGPGSRSVRLERRGPPRRRRVRRPRTGESHRRPHRLPDPRRLHRRAGPDRGLPREPPGLRRTARQCLGRRGRPLRHRVDAGHRGHLHGRWPCLLGRSPGGGHHSARSGRPGGARTLRSGRPGGRPGRPGPGPLRDPAVAPRRALHLLASGRRHPWRDPGRFRRRRRPGPRVGSGAGGARGESGPVRPGRCRRGRGRRGGGACGRGRPLGRGRGRRP